MEDTTIDSPNRSQAVSDGTHLSEDPDQVDYNPETTANVEPRENLDVILPEVEDEGVHFSPHGSENDHGLLGHVGERPESIPPHHDHSHHNDDAHGNHHHHENDRVHHHETDEINSSIPELINHNRDQETNNFRVHQVSAYSKLLI